MFSDWSSADWTSNVMGLLLFAIGWFLGRKQGQIIEHVGVLTESQANVTQKMSELTGEVHSLQTAIAELQIREKIGVIKERAHQVEQGEQKAVYTLLEDSCSVLPLYEWASKSLQTDYERSLDQAFIALSKTSSNNSWVLEEMARRLVVFSQELFDRNIKDLSESIRDIIIKGVFHAFHFGDVDNAMKICSLIAPTNLMCDIFRDSDDGRIGERIQTLLR